MNTKERIQKIKQAESLIREVEFSYPIGHKIRQDLYRLVVNTFSFIGPMPNIIKAIETESWTCEHGNEDPLLCRECVEEIVG